MEKFEKETYLEPKICVISVATEKGFAGSPNRADGDFGHWDTETEWEEED